MDLLLKLLSTAAAGALDVWVGIITGVALGLSPALSGAVSVASAVAGVTLVVVAGGRLRRLIYRSRRLATAHVLGHKRSEQVCRLVKQSPPFGIRSGTSRSSRRVPAWAT